jgi:hypothetical protein
MDYIEEAQQEAKLRYGRELSPQELEEKFLGHDRETRIFHLKNLKTPEEMTIREAADRMEYESRLYRVHEQSTLADR